MVLQHLKDIREDNDVRQTTIIWGFPKTHIPNMKMVLSPYLQKCW